MKLLRKGKWLPDLLSFYCSEQETTITVLGWAVLSPVSDLYFTPQKNWRVIFNYLREIGIRDVIKKVRSRQAETLRNEKFFSIGFGIVKCENKTVLNTAIVGFFAPCHPLCVDEIVIPHDFTIPLDLEKLRYTASDSLDKLHDPVSDSLDKLSCPTSDSGFPSLSYDQILFYDAKNKIKVPNVFSDLAGWSIYSGITVKPVLHSLQSAILTMLTSIDWRKATAFKLHNDTLKTPTLKKRQKNNLKAIAFKRKPRAAIVGYGQYAKTNIIPNIKPYVELTKIYEIDPTQIPFNRKNYQWSTSSYPDFDDKIDVYFIATYHHMHAPIAERVIHNGAVAVVEKPVVVDAKQLGHLLETLKKTQGQIYSCYHKRFSILNSFALHDLATHSNDPIHYHCIVYEVPLPIKHWYSWPNSHSRIMSNGCHWLDHFLFLNAYAIPTKVEGFLASEQTINCTVSLNNGAIFTMVLTEIGSSRVGVQDYIQLRAGSTTVHIENGHRYFSENKNKILRKKVIKKLQSYETMYKTIANDLGHANLCDSIQSLEVNNKLIIELEAQVFNSNL